LKHYIEKSRRIINWKSRLGKNSRAHARVYVRETNASSAKILLHARRLGKVITPSCQLDIVPESETALKDRRG